MAASGGQGHGAAAPPSRVVREARIPAVRRGDAPHNHEAKTMLGKVGARPPPERRERIGPKAPAVVAHDEH